MASQGSRPETQISGEWIGRSEGGPFAQVSRRRCCALLSAESSTALPGIGTGTAVRHRDQYYIVTAQHVANDFYSMKLGWVVFDRLPQFDRRETECIFQDERLDLAVIHVRPKMTRALGETLPLDLSDLGTEEDFSAAVPNNGRNYGLLGLPGILAELVQPNRIELRPLIYETVVIASGDHATLELGFHSGAPDPHGISGSLVFELPDPKPDELWHPGKAIALEHRWSSSRQTILCSPVHPVRAAIAAHGSSGVD